MDLEAEQPRFTFVTVILLIAAVVLAVVVIDNWPELRDSFRSSPSAPSNPTGRH